MIGESFIAASAGEGISGFGLSLAIANASTAKGSTDDEISAATECRLCISFYSYSALGPAGSTGVS